MQILTHLECKLQKRETIIRINKDEFSVSYEYMSNKIKRKNSCNNFTSVKS